MEQKLVCPFCKKCLGLYKDIGSSQLNVTVLNPKLIDDKIKKGCFEIKCNRCKNFVYIKFEYHNLEDNRQIIHF